MKLHISFARKSCITAVLLTLGSAVPAFASPDDSIDLQMQRLKAQMQRQAQVQQQLSAFLAHLHRLPGH